MVSKSDKCLCTSFFASGTNKSNGTSTLVRPCTGHYTQTVIQARFARARTGTSTARYYISLFNDVGSRVTQIHFFIIDCEFLEASPESNICASIFQVPRGRKHWTTLLHEINGEWYSTTILAHVVKWSLIFHPIYLNTFIWVVN